MSEFGTQLREAREACGIPLRQIAASTKISVGVLEALERGDCSKLPGGIFGRAFVRAYARAVGLDAEAIVAEYLEEVRRTTAAVRPPPARISAEDRAFVERQQRAARVLRWTLVALAVVLVAAVVWWFSARAHRAPRTPISHARAAGGGPGASGPPPSTTAPAAGVQTGVGPPAAVDPAPAHVSIELLPSAECWTQVTVDGKTVLNRLLLPGERQQFTGRWIQLQVGNAGAMTWSIDGRPAASLGGFGVKRTATITPQTAATFVK